MAAHFSVERQGALATIALTGRFDFASRLRFQRVRDELAADASTRYVVLDFARVTGIDSSALGMMLLMQDALAPGRKRLAIRNARVGVRAILEVADFGPMLLD
jgi:HptB-dependent secretion and biofilm anti anti-sigma factor